MKRIMITICLGLILAGCGKSSQEQAAVGNNMQREEAAKKLFAQSMILLQQKDLKGAVETLKASISLDPTDPNPYLVLGQLLIKAEEFVNATQFLDQTAKTFPNNGTVFYMLSIANKMAGNNLPAVLAARRSYEIFKATADTGNAQTSASLLQELILQAQAAQTEQEVAQGTRVQSMVNEKMALPVKK